MSLTFFFVAFLCFNLCFTKPPLGFLPNIVILYADDLGYGDLGCYGNPLSLTPNLDQLASQGTKITSFYSTSPVCSPSRAGLLTGRFQTRNGVWGNANSPLVFYQPSIGGLPLNETTIAKFLKSNNLNYSTAIIGKWHLGIGENMKYLPTNHGFDFFTGIPTVHDDPNPPYCFPEKRGCWPATAIDPWNDTCIDTYSYESIQSGVQPEKRLADDIYYSPQELKQGSPPLQLMWNTEVIQQPINITMIPSWYTQWSIQFMNNSLNSNNPFFLYMAYDQTHHPQFASSMFFNTTQRGMFGDALSEMDYNVGLIMDFIKSNDKLKNTTFVFFSADNGPSLMRESRGGNNGILKCGKGTTYEGGVRVPGIAWMNNYITSGRTTRQLGSTLDMFPTIAELVDVPLPNDRYYDGVSMYNWLFNNNGKSLRDTIYYWPEDPDPNFGWQKSLHAVRINEWKLHWITGGSHCPNYYSDIDCRSNTPEKILGIPKLYNLYHDISERYNVSISDSYYFNIYQRINKSWEYIFNTPGLFGVSQVEKGSNWSYAPCCGCNYGDSNWPTCCQCNKINTTYPHL